MKKNLICLAAVLLCGLLSTAFTTSSSSAAPLLLTETISAYVGTLSGPNDVELVMERTGSTAGDGCVTFDVTLWFNDEENTHTYTFTMSNGQTTLTEHIQGPVPTAFAGVSGDPFNIVYGCD